MGGLLPKGVHVEEFKRDGVLLGCRGRVSGPRTRGTWIKGSKADPASKLFDAYPEAEAWARGRLERYLGTFRRAGVGIDSEITRRRRTPTEFGEQFIAGREWTANTGQRGGRICGCGLPCWVIRFWIRSPRRGLRRIWARCGMPVWAVRPGRSGCGCCVWCWPLRGMGIPQFTRQSSELSGRP
jgi:hypothetical protein